MDHINKTDIAMIILMKNITDST